MAFHLPKTLRLADLKLLAFKCGLISSGTKPILSQNLQHAITTIPPSFPKGTRILSIDMGIRNLAYCILDVPSEHAINVTSKVSKRKEMRGTTEKLVPSIHAWHRLAVSRAPTSDPSTPAVKENFDPSTLSAAAYTLLQKRLLLDKPTHILIERQRFRSMGSKHILEWTVRVNMLESILHAMLYTLRAEGLWEGEVVSVTPGKVGPFWVDEGVSEGHRKERNTKSAKIKNKGLKIDLVRRWLDADNVVALGNESVEGIARQYVQKWDRKPGGKSSQKELEKDEHMGKLDDLADCLLQGMAWIQWEENKRLAFKDGVEALLPSVADEMDIE